MDSAPQKASEFADYAVLAIAKSLHVKGSNDGGTQPAMREASLSAAGFGAAVGRKH